MSGVKRLGIALILFSALATLSHPIPQSLSAAGSAIDPLVLQDTSNGQVGKFLVVLKSQANTEALSTQAANRETQGQMVMDALRQTAGATQPAVIAQLNALGARYRDYWVANVIAVEGNRAVVDAMAARPEVASIETNRPFRVTLEHFTAAPAAASAVEWNISQVNAPAVWAKGITGQGSVYANADGGVQWDHPALKSHYRGWNGTTANHNYNWWDAIRSPIVGGNACGYNIAQPCDATGHGTHTMGTGVGGDGSANQVGVAPGAKWIACRNYDQYLGQSSTYLECLQFFLAPTDLSGHNPDPGKRPDTVGNSYDCASAEGCSAHVMQIAMENLRAAGVFMAASAGNSGSACATINTPPALEASAITVGATDQNDAIAAFSSRGPVTIDGSNRRKPDLVAPGVNVRSSVPSNGYALGSGTSMSSPHVAGAVALLWSAFPKLRGKVDLTQNALQQAAKPLTSGQGCGGDGALEVPNNAAGYGRLDILAAYNYAASLPPVRVFFPFVVR